VCKESVNPVTNPNPVHSHNPKNVTIFVGNDEVFISTLQSAQSLLIHNTRQTVVKFPLLETPWIITVRITIFWDVTPCSPEGVHISRGDTSCSSTCCSLFSLRCLPVLYMEQVYLTLCTHCLLVAFVAYSSTLNLETIRSSEMSMNFYQSTRRHIPDGRTHHSQRCENWKLKPS
jgi:hypothetical protein